MWVLRFILHDWNDDDAARILAALRGAMGTTPVTLCICEARSPLSWNAQEHSLYSTHQRGTHPQISNEHIEMHIHNPLWLTCAALDACMHASRVCTTASCFCNSSYGFKPCQLLSALLTLQGQRSADACSAGADGVHGRVWGPVQKLCQMRRRPDGHGEAQHAGMLLENNPVSTLSVAYSDPY